MIIATDFDDTIVYSDYPQIGELIPFAKDVINHLWQRGHTIIINSCRTGEAENAMKFFLIYNEIKYDYINENSPRKIKQYGTDTRKISCDINIDDTNFLIKRDMHLEGKDIVQESIWQVINDSMMFMEKPVVICVVGESGTGKTMVADYFTYQYGVNLIESYTDRPKRHQNETGHTFLSPEAMDKVVNGEMLAYTKFGEYRYCCLYSDIAKANVYIIDEDGLTMLRKEWGDVLDIYTIRVHRDYDKRLDSVGKNRVARDEGRFNLPDSYYDFVIKNLTEEKEDIYKQVRKFVHEFRLEERFTDYEPLYLEYGED